MSNSDRYFVEVVVDVRDEEKIKELVKELDRVSNTLPRAGGATKEFNKSLKKTQIEMRATGRGLQNASYQIQDFIVQVSGGVDPLRSFSQQAPQLLINMGALGAVIGVVAAGLPILIQQFTSGAEGAKEFDESLKDLRSTLDDAVAVTGDVDFKKWIDGWNKSSEAVRKNRLEILQFNLLVAQGNLIDSQEALGEDLGEAAGRGWLNGIKAFLASAGLAQIGEIVPVEELRGQIEDANIAEALELPPNAVSEYERLIAAFAESNDVEALASGLRQLALNYGSVSEELVTLAKNAQDLADIQKQIQATGDLSSQAEGGGILPGGSTDKEAGRLAREAAQAYRELGAAYQALYPEQVKFFEQIKLANAQMEAGFINAEEYAMRTKAAAEELTGSEETDRIARLFEESQQIGRDDANNNIAESMTIAAESTQIFLDTFESAVDGVARGTQDMSQAFESMAKSIILQIGKLLATKGIGMFLSGQGGFLGDVGTALRTNAKGNAFSDGNVVPFAKGGVVRGPTIFPMANGAGLMGEAGPEAVMPLSRDSRGRLGVSGGGMNVVVNNMAAGVEITPRQDDEGLTLDVVLASVAADVRRGGNVLSDALENTYSVGRGRGVY